MAQDRMLQSLSYKNVLARGYAVIRDENDRPVSRAEGISQGQAIAIEFADGRVAAVAGDIEAADDLAQTLKGHDAVISSVHFSFSQSAFSTCMS